MGKIVGIDLGTTNSVVAVMEGAEPTVIPLAEGSRLCPSVVGFNKAGERVVGQLAKRQAVSNPDRTVSSIKRQMGKDYKVAIDGKQYTPQEISAIILQKLKTDAEAYLGAPVTQAVITVPAYFSDAQRQATKDAGSIAGLDVLRIINEPTAAALAYGIEKQDVQTVLVWDLGGGTFDVSVLELDNGVFEVKATNGDTRLGGDDWDEAIVDWLASEFQSQHGIDLKRDRMALQRLREAAEKAKVELSSVVTSSINLPFISSTPEGPVHLEISLTRAHMESLTSALLERMLPPTRQALADAKLEPSQISRVMMVGGMTRMPAVQDLAQRFFSQEPYRGVNPDEVVALGAAIQAGVLGGDVKDVVLLDVTPLSLGIETLGGIMSRLIERNTTIPSGKTQTFSTAVDNQRSVEIKVYQGERELVAHSKLLGNFQLTGIQPAPKGVPRIDVTFDIDVNGIVHVSAKDQSTGSEQRVMITSSGGLSKEEIQRMVHEAEEHGEEDRRRRDELELRNRAEATVDSAERTLVSAGDKALDLSARVREAVASLREKLAAGDRAETRAAIDTVAAAAYDLAAAAARPEAAADPEPEAPESPVQEGVKNEDEQSDVTDG